MLTITTAAAEQIRLAAQQGGMEGMPLRIAAKRADGGTIEYMIGFDEMGDEDVELTLEGVHVLISEFSNDLLKDTILDFVELTPGEFQFIFIPPKEQTSRPHEAPSPDVG
ncbi:MAG: HesB/IscA family protein [Acidiferrobacter sp.]